MTLFPRPLRLTFSWDINLVPVYMLSIFCRCLHPVVLLLIILTLQQMDKAEQVPENQQEVPELLLFLCCCVLRWFCWNNGVWEDDTKHPEYFKFYLLLWGRNSPLLITNMRWVLVVNASPEHGSHVFAWFAALLPTCSQVDTYQMHRKYLQSDMEIFLYLFCSYLEAYFFKSSN